MTEVARNYESFYKEYMGIFEPLFRGAYEKSEINLILTLIAFRGSSDDGWKPFENTLDIVELVYKNQKKFKRSLQFNINLWMYQHLIESSEQYEVIANLIKATKGEDYVVANHENRNFVNLKVEQKIDRLKKIAAGTLYANVSEPFRRSFNARFRNAIAHADYSIKRTGTKGVTVIDDSGYPKIYTEQESSDLINRALALHVSIRTLMASYVGHYSTPQQVMSSLSLGGGQVKPVDLIIRKKHGVIGISFIGGYDDGVPFKTQLYNCLPYEQKMIERGVFYLPKSRVNRANRFLDAFPRPIARKLLPIVNKLIER